MKNSFSPAQINSLLNIDARKLNISIQKKNVAKSIFNLLLIAMLSVFGSQSFGQTDIARWTYEPFQGTIAAPTPNTGSGSSLIRGSMSGAGTATGMSGTTGCGSQVTGTLAWAIATANPGSTNESSGVQYNVSTAGYSGISFTWDQRFSGSAVSVVLHLF